MQMSRVHAAILGASLTVLALVGGLMIGVLAGTFIFGALEGNLPAPLTYTLAGIAFGAGMLGGSALWGMGMARLARMQVSRRAAWAGILGFMPITLLLAIVLRVSEPIALAVNLPLHRLFTLLFVPSALLIAGASSLALGWALGWGRVALALALRGDLTAALAFLMVNLSMEALGWQVGGPRAAERLTMLTVLFVSNLGAALAGGAMLGITLAQRHRNHSHHDIVVAQ